MRGTLKGLHRVCRKVTFLGSYPRADGVRPKIARGFTSEDYAAAETWMADLIGMGTHGWGEFMNLIMGSVAEGVLRKSDVPVMLLRYRDEESR